ncbi:hypothetical protein [Bradyrhizobium sp. SZCCHNS2005]|uniref:hypothetical protein n=1 Tax=Bradyrhizobium sp. SZCCHNS2005 TaxID=3057303 RepID=UPI0028EECCC9|nr:hypothetical protein [Bradyrhizobium sp. SZCCHNS2005]
MFAGAGITATGFDPDCDGSYTIKSATHTLNSSGLKTRISCETAGEGDGDTWGGSGGE